MLHPRTAAFPPVGTINQVLFIVLSRQRKLNLKAKVMGKNFFFYFFLFSEMNFAVSQLFILVQNRRG